MEAQLHTNGPSVSGQFSGPIKVAKTSMLKITFEKFAKNKLALIGLVLFLLVVILALLTPYIAPYDPTAQNLLYSLKPPSKAHWMGTDDFGRDILSRILYGSRVSLTVGIVTVLGTVAIGTTIGAIAGYYGGKIDNILMRFVDIMISFPHIFLLIAVVTILKPSMKNIIIVLIALGWTGIARIVRGQFLSLKEQDYVLSARSIGMSDFRLIFLHILPNAIAPIIVAATLGIGGTILQESVLSFLGLGIQPPIASWGNMLQGAQSITIMLTAWWYPLFPGLMILLTVLCVNFIGDGLRDALDPRSK